MSVAEKTRRTKAIVVDLPLFRKLKKEYGERIRELEDDEVINARDSKWYKEVSAKHTPGRALRVYRENRGFSQAELAVKLGVAGRQYVADMESGRRGISVPMARKLAGIFSTSAERFLKL